MSELSIRFTPGEQDVWRKPEEIPVSEWAQRHVRVMDGPHAGGGWKNDRTAYLVGVMDAWGMWSVQTVVVCGSPQSGKTRSMYNCLMYSICHRPGPKMIGMQDDDNLKKVVEHKLLPGLKKTPVTGRRFVKYRKTDILFADGSPLYLASAQSEGDRASVSVRDLFLDEEDLYKKFQTKGAPVEEFLERITSFKYKNKVFRASKPLGGEDSSVWRGLLECDEIRAYAVKCPACGTSQLMRFSQIKFLEGCRDAREMRQRKLARYECEHCKYHWSNHVRDVAVRNGQWVPVRFDEKKGFVRTEASPGPKSVGFHLPALISPFVGLESIAAAFLAAQADPSRWANFFNGMLAEPHRPTKLKTSVERVLELRDPHLPARTVPAAAVALTAGIDTQKRGFWYVVRAWAPDLSSWLIDYGRLGAFDDVRMQILEATYPQEETGRLLPIWRAGIDSGGGETEGGVWTRTEEVYSFVARHGARRLFATKGGSTSQFNYVRISNIEKMPKSGLKIAGGLQLYILDTDYFKQLFHGRMEIESASPIRLHAETDETYAKQIMAEELVERKGKLVWEVKYRENHLLDCEVIAAACASQAWAPSLETIARIQQDQSMRNDRPPPPAAGSGTVGRGKPSWLGGRAR